MQLSIIILLVTAILIYKSGYIKVGNKGKFLLKQLFDDLPSIPPGVELTGHAHAETVVLPTRDTVKKNKSRRFTYLTQHALHSPRPSSYVLSREHTVCNTLHPPQFVPLLFSQLQNSLPPQTVRPSTLSSLIFCH